MFDVDDIVDKVARLTFDYESVYGQMVNEEVVEFYKERFRLFVNDGVKSAITLYMRKANEDSTLNDITKLFISNAGVKALNGEEI